MSQSSETALAGVILPEGQFSWTGDGDMDRELLLDLGGGGSLWLDRLDLERALAVLVRDRWELMSDGLSRSGLISRELMSSLSSSDSVLTVSCCKRNV